MGETEIRPQTITKPIQLLAAWLAGLVLVDSAFLVAAQVLTRPAWLSPMLAIAAVANVPLFLICIFLLQTRFRPEMQEDSFYSQYLGQKSATRAPELIQEIATLRSELLAANKATIGLIQNVQHQSIEIAAELTRAPPPHQASSSDAQSLATILKEGRANVGRIERVLHRTEWLRASVLINVYLDNYNHIVNKLDEADVVIAGTFGSLHLQKRVLSIGHLVPLKLARQVIRAVGSELDFVDMITEERHRANVIIGSYSYQLSTFSGVPLTLANITMLTDPSLTDDAFLSRFANNPRKIDSTV